MKRRILKFIIVCVFIEIGVYFAKDFILQETSTTNLSVSKFSNTVSENLDGASGNLATIGKNYNIQSVQYFEDNTWVVIGITALNNEGDNAVLVLQEKDGKYETVVSPGNSFSPDSVQNLPTPVLYYLNTLGVVNYGSGE